MDSGFDILFPIEVGTWKASPVEFRRKYGRQLRMFGGVDKHVIAQGEAAIRSHLMALRPVAMEGGFIPIPDHRIPPSVSLEQFRQYVRIFKEVFGRAR
jgi:uroporphyrinogen decarboxylase